MKKALIGIGVIVIIIAAFSVAKTTFAPRDLSCTVDHPSLQHLVEQKTESLMFGGTKYTVWVANDPFSQQKGLSDTFCLPDGYGMLFEFSTPKIQRFWMKDMNYPIDIVWLDNEKREIGRVKNADPKGYLQTPPVVYSSPIEVRYVLEIPATVDTKKVQK